MSEIKDIFDRWYIRYPVAIFLLLGLWYSIANKLIHWLYAIILGLGSVMSLIPEVPRVIAGVIFIIICMGVLYGLIQGLASLPVSIAIIIGALIIAMAISDK
jgi:hypothetical protein